MKVAKTSSLVFAVKSLIVTIFACTSSTAFAPQSHYSISRKSYSCIWKTVLNGSNLASGKGESEGPRILPLVYPAKLEEDMLTIQERRKRRRKAKTKLLEDDKKRAGGAENMRKSSMFSIATSATIEQVAFAVRSPPIVLNDVIKTPFIKDDKKMKWYLESPGKTYDALIGVDQSSTSRKKDTWIDRRTKAYNFFHLLQKENNTLTEERTEQLASLLNITKVQAEHLVRKAPTLVNVNVSDGVLASRCIELSLLLQCTPQRLASVVKRCPSILTFRSTTLARNLIDLDRLLSCQEIEHNVVPRVRSSSVAIANRVPTLLVSNVQETLHRRAQELKALLFGADVDAKKDLQFERVLRRCPELLLYDITKTIAPKIQILNAHFSEKVENRDDIGCRLVQKEPRLLLYAVEKSLVPKEMAWRKRVLDPHEFDELLRRYPTLLMYSLGSVARLDYFAYRNGGRKPNSKEARQLLMMPLLGVELWGDRMSLLSKQPSVLSSGKLGIAGRPRREEMKKIIDDQGNDQLLSYFEWITVQVSALGLTVVDTTLKQAEKYYGTLAVGQVQINS